jgi:hypothetical protein
MIEDIYFMRGYMVQKLAYTGFKRYRVRDLHTSSRGTQKNGDTNKQAVVTELSVLYTADFGFGQIKLG